MWVNHPMESGYAGTSITADEREMDVVTVKMNDIESGNILKDEIHHANVVW